MAELPYKRWFFYLLIACVLTLVRPYFHSETSRINDPSIPMFVETTEGFKPVPEPIWIDGRTSSLLMNSAQWLYYAIVLIVIELAVGFVSSRHASARRRHVSGNSGPTSRKGEVD